MSKMLEERVQRLEDKPEIYNLQARYQFVRAGGHNDFGPAPPEER